MSAGSDASGASSPIRRDWYPVRAIPASSLNLAGLCGIPVHSFRDMLAAIDLGPELEMVNLSGSRLTADHIAVLKERLQGITVRGFDFSDMLFLTDRDVLGQAYEEPEQSDHIYVNDRVQRGHLPLEDLDPFEYPESWRQFTRLVQKRENSSSSSSMKGEDLSWANQLYGQQDGLLRIEQCFERDSWVERKMTFGKKAMSGEEYWYAKVLTYKCVVRAAGHCETQ